MRTPSDYRKQYETETDEQMARYKINYARWMIFCRVPMLCDSMPKKRTSLSFGGIFLKQIVVDFTGVLLDKSPGMSIWSVVEENQETQSGKVAFLLPEFFAELIEELQDPNSYLWKLGEDSLMSELSASPENALCDSNLDLEEDVIVASGSTPIHTFFSTPKRPTNVLSPRTPENFKRVLETFLFSPFFAS